MKIMHKKTITYAMLVSTTIVFSWFISTRQLKVNVLKISMNTTDDSSSLPIFKVKPLVIWTSDLHFGPTTDLKHYLEPMGVKFIDKNLDSFEYRCRPRNACNDWKSLKVINPKNAVNLNHDHIPRFYEAYKNDSEMKTVDAFACFHVSSLCELFEPFNKSLIIIATIRYELGRHSKTAWTTWNQNLVKYASHPWNVVAANNLYDVEYIKYFTGIQPQLLPSWCSYPNQTYNPSRPGFLIASNYKNTIIEIFHKNFTQACSSVNCTVNLTPLRQKYRYYKYSDIAAHQGLIYVPYQVSVMSFFEQYRMNIPIFAPTRELLLFWEMKYNLVSDRRWGTFKAKQGVWSPIEPHPSQRSIPDPNSSSEHSLRYWLQFCDYYQFPHVTYYNSVEDLVGILQSENKDRLMKISEQMKMFNIQENKRLTKIWKDILKRIANNSKNNPR